MQQIEEFIQKKKEQARFSQLQLLRKEVEKRSFHLLDPLSLILHPHTKEAQIRAVETYGMGSVSGRPLARHIDYQNRVEQLIHPNALFIQKEKNELMAFFEPYSPIFHDDFLSSLVFQFTPLPKADLILSNFPSITPLVIGTSAVKDFLIDTFNPPLLPITYLGAIEGMMELIPSMQRERKEVEKLTTRVYRELDLLGFKVEKGPFYLTLSTYYSDKLHMHLRQQQITTKQSKKGIELFFRADHQESEIISLIEAFKNYEKKVEAIAI